MYMTEQDEGPTFPTPAQLAEAQAAAARTRPMSDNATYQTSGDRSPELIIQPPTEGVTSFDTGSVRDKSDGKGAFDLMPGDALAEIGRAMAQLPVLCEQTEAQLYGQVLDLAFAEPGPERSLLADMAACAAWAMLIACGPEGRAAYVARMKAQTGPGLRSPYLSLPYEGLLCLGLRLELGANNYTPRNWELGQTYSRTMASLRRHAVKMAAGHTDEDHTGAVIWNALVLVTYELRGMGDKLDDWTRRTIVGGKAKAA